MDDGAFDGVFDGIGTFGIIFFAFIALFFVFVLGAVLVAVIKGVAIWNRNNQSPVETAPATVVAKRDEHHSRSDGPSSTYYYATFELPDGSRREFAVDGSEFGLLAERDRGQLSFQGTRFKGFARMVEER